MEYVEKGNNRVYVRGEIVSTARYSHEIYGEGFYEMDVMIKRLSGQADVLPITVSERLIQEKDLQLGKTISAIGQFRSYNKLVDNKSKLMLTVFARDIVENEENKNPNSITLSGYVCKEPVYRTTPFNREIADVLLAVNRAYNKSDYIPCIAWGRNARFVKNLQVGDFLTINGRIQSREYQKKFSEDDVRTMTAYEVSINKLSTEEETFVAREEENSVVFNNAN